MWLSAWLSLRGHLELDCRRLVLSLLRGTEGSNPSPSSAESHANSVLPGIAVGHRRIRAVCGHRAERLLRGVSKDPITVAAMTGIGVRREKAALSSGCKAHPAIRSSRKQSEQSWR